MATIHDVARKARVSNTTVSNVLNGRTDRMQTETLTRVRAAIAELGYHPNSVARSLKAGESPLLGLLVPSIANPSYCVIAREIEKVALEKYNRRLLLGSTQRDPQNELEFINTLMSYGVRGIIVISDRKGFSRLVAEKEHDGLIVASYDHRPSENSLLSIDYMTIDNRTAGEIAARHLIEHGHRRLAFATVQGRTTGRLDKIEGFCTIAKQTPSVESVEILESQTQSTFGDADLMAAGDTLAEKILDARDRPTGIFAVNDFLAVSLIAGLRQRGLSVPEDISIIGMDDLFLCSLNNPPLTSISIPRTEIAEMMVDRVVERLANPTIAPAEFLFPPTLVPRQSVALRR